VSSFVGFVGSLRVFVGVGVEVGLGAVASLEPVGRVVVVGEGSGWVVGSVGSLVGAVVKLEGADSVVVDGLSLGIGVAESVLC